MKVFSFLIALTYLTSSYGCQNTADPINPQNSRNKQEILTDDDCWCIDFWVTGGNYTAAHCRAQRIGGGYDESCTTPSGQYRDCFVYNPPAGTYNCFCYDDAASGSTVISHPGPYERRIAYVELIDFYFAK